MNNKYINLYQEEFEKFFIKESTRQKTNPDIYEFAVRYSEFRMNLANKTLSIDVQNSKENTQQVKQIEFLEVGTDLHENHLRRFEIPEIVFFGIENKIEPTHKHLTDKRAFWSLLGYLYTYTEFPAFIQNEIKESCNTQDRLSVNLLERNRCIQLFHITCDLFMQHANEYVNDKNLARGRNIFIAVRDDMILGRFGISFNGKIVSSRKFCNVQARMVCEKSNDNLKKLLDKNDYLNVYRGFDIYKCQNIRTDRYKSNNPLAHKQDAGSGMSYTPTNEGSKIYAMSKFKDTLTLSNNERVNNKSFFKFSLLNINSKEFLDTNNKFPVVGKYLLKKNDILFSKINVTQTEHDLHNNEIACFADSTFLVDYRILPKSTEVKIFEKIS
jgi:hypothetical protein